MYLEQMIQKLIEQNEALLQKQNALEAQIKELVAAIQQPTQPLVQPYVAPAPVVPPVVDMPPVVDYDTSYGDNDDDADAFIAFLDNLPESAFKVQETEPYVCEGLMQAPVQDVVQDVVQAPVQETTPAPANIDYAKERADVGKLLMRMMLKHGDEGKKIVNELLANYGATCINDLSNEYLVKIKTALTNMLTPSEA